MVNITKEASSYKELAKVLVIENVFVIVLSKERDEKRIYAFIGLQGGEKKDVSSFY